MFTNTNLVNLKGRFTVNRYRIVEPEILYKRLRVRVSNMLYFYMHMIPRPHTVSIVRDYQREVLETLCLLFDKPPVSEARLLHYMNSVDLIDTKDNERVIGEFIKYTCSHLELPEPDVDEHTWWGHSYWEFLHLTSIIAHDDRRILNCFAALLVNFCLALPCGTCSKNMTMRTPC